MPRVGQLWTGIALGLAGAIALASMPATSRAQDSLPLELEWRAPEQCPQAAELRAELSRIARVQAGFTLSPLTASGEVQTVAGRYVVRLQTSYEGEAGERLLEARDCRTLARSVTLVLALAFGPGVALAGDAPEAALPKPEEQEPAEPAQPVPVPQEPTAQDGDDEASSTRELRVALLAGAGAQLALFPSTALELALGVELASGAWSVELQTGLWPAVEKQVAADAHARFDGLNGTLLGCAELTRTALRAQLCAGPRVAALRGRSTGALESGSAMAPWYALSAGAQLSWPSTARIRLRVQARLALSLNRPQFSVENLPLTHRVPALVPDVGASVSFDL